MDSIKNVYVVGNIRMLFYYGGMWGMQNFEVIFVKKFEKWKLVNYFFFSFY